MKKSVLFYRDFRRFAGGHLKVSDYYDHVKSSQHHRPEIYLTPSSLAENPWRSKAGLVDSYRPDRADALFLAGLDWNALKAFPRIEEQVPIINLIQGLRHAVPGNPRFQFLTRKATRICVSAEVADAVRGTGICNGPLHVIPNGIDLGHMPGRPKDADVFIAGLKRPNLASRLASRLGGRGMTVDCETEQVERREFLQRMSRARIAIVLPLDKEGFFLPALEAMAMGCLVICPDCVGNRSHCIDRVTALVPEADLDSIEAALVEALGRPELAASIRLNSSALAQDFDIDVERARFLELLDELAGSGA